MPAKRRIIRRTSVPAGSGPPDARRAGASCHAATRQAPQMRASSSIAGSTRCCQRADDHDLRLHRAGAGACAERMRLHRLRARAPGADRAGRRRACRRPRTRASRAPAGRPSRAAIRAGARRRRASCRARASAGQLDRLREPAAHERLARCRQAERGQVPADHFGARGELEARAVLGDAAAVGDGSSGSHSSRAPAATRAVSDCAAVAPVLR